MTRANINQELIRQCMHRFRALEVELNDAASNGTIQAVEYAKRRAVLQQLGQKISELEMSAAASKISFNQASAIDLPLLEECSREEQTIILTALHNSKKLTEQLNRDADKLKECIRESTSQEASWVKVILRLSWLRARMSWLDTQISTTRSVRGVLEDFIRKVAPQKENAAPQADLVDAFREFETSTSRIANLRTKLRSEIAKNYDQEAWLRRYEETRRNTSKPVAPPVPAELELAKNGIAARFLNGSKNANERLVIARKLADSLTKESRAKAIEKDKEKPTAKDVLSDIPVRKAKVKNYGKGVRK